VLIVAFLTLMIYFLAATPIIVSEMHNLLEYAKRLFLARELNFFLLGYWCKFGMDDYV